MAFWWGVGELRLAFRKIFAGMENFSLALRQMKALYDDNAMFLNLLP